MVDVVDVSPSKKPYGSANNTFLNRLSSGFMSMMRNLQTRVAGRLTNTRVEEAVDLEEPYSDREKYDCFEDGWHSELMEKFEMNRRGSRY